MKRKSQQASKSQRATRTDVARLAQVSTAVVSYVMNNGPKNVAPATSERVRQAAKALKYRPNSTARALRMGVSHMFGVVVPDFRNPYFADFNEAVEKEASRHGYSTMFLSSHADPNTEHGCIEKLLLRNVDAIFAAPAQSLSQLASIDRQDCVFVMLDSKTAFIDSQKPIPGFKAVSSDLMDGVDLAVQHLVGHGRTRTAMLFGGDLPSDDGRVLGWYQAHQKLRIPAGPILHSGYTDDGAYHAINELIDSENRPNALFISSDFEAIGALRALHERNIRIPEDIAVISFDGTFMCKNTWPQLTAVHQNVNLIAKTAVNAALHSDVPNSQIIPTTIDIRQSCGC